MVFYVIRFKINKNRLFSDKFNNIKLDEPKSINN